MEFAVALERVVAAPRARVYRAWLDPSVLARWMGPDDFSVVVATVDERVGGSHVVEMIDADGGPHVFTSVIEELVPDERIVLTFRFGPGGADTLLTVTFADAEGGGTLLRLSHERVTGDGPRTTLMTHTEVRDARSLGCGGAELDLLHTETGEAFSVRTGGVVLATGYGPTTPDFLRGIEDRIRRDPRGRYDVADDYSVDVAGGEVFVQNAEEHTHSLLAPDLGMGPYRNSVIIAAMLGREVYPVEKRIAVQTFGVPDQFRQETVR